jgi:hypothetical protein
MNGNKVEKHFQLHGTNTENIVRRAKERIGITGKRCKVKKEKDVILMQICHSNIIVHIKEI